MKAFINGILHSRITLFYLICAICWGIAEASIYFNITRIFSLRLTLVMIAGLSLMACLPVWLLRGRWRMLMPLLIWVISIFCLANIVYHRNWHNMLPVNLIFDSSCYNAMVFNAGTSALVWSDLLLALPPLAATAAYFGLKMSRVPAPGIKVATLMSLLSLMAGFCALSAQTIAINRYKRSVDTAGVSFAGTFKELFEHNPDRCQKYSHNGMVIYLCSELKNTTMPQKITLTEEQRQSLAEFLKESPVIPASFTANRGKNVVMIIVESLNARQVSRFSGITPVLDSLLALPGTISALNVIPQVRDGRSADGQLIYNTGLLPLKSGVCAMDFGGNAFPSLAKALNYSISVEYICENASLWNHGVTTKSYGYDRLEYDLDSEAGASRDSAVFKNALKDIVRLSQPFLAEITTLTMHYPYDEPYVAEPDAGARPDSIPELQRKYLSCLHEFDTQLGHFLKGLDEAALTENTLIFIASDHDEITSEQERTATETAPQPIVFIALGTGITKSITRPVGQIDVFPTMLELTGCAGADWRGLGRSMLDSSACAVVDASGNVYGTGSVQDVERQRRAWSVSDSVIRSNFFAP